MKILILILLSLPVFAQFYDPSQNEWSEVVTRSREFHSLSAFAVAVLLVQGIFLLIRTSLGELIGVHRLLILSILSVVVTIGTKLVQGEPVLLALFDAPTLISYQVLSHQLMKQWRKREEDRGLLASHSDSDCSSDRTDS
jgi:hypothetical protein